MLKTLRAILYRALQLLVLGLLIYGFAQTLPLDIALLFAGDTMLYVEAAAALWLAAQVTRFRLAFAYARAIAGRTIGGARRRARRLARGAARLARGPKAEDDPERGLAFACSWPAPIAAAGRP